MMNSEISPAGVIRPILLLSNSGNHRFPSGPAVMLKTRVVSGSGNSVITPDVVMRPIAKPGPSVNHKFPPDPGVMVGGVSPPAGIGYSAVTTPAIVIRPILLGPVSVNH